MMKNKIPSEGLRLGRDSGSILCDTLKKVAFSDSLGGVFYSVDTHFVSEYSVKRVCRNTTNQQAHRTFFVWYNYGKI